MPTRFKNDPFENHHYNYLQAASWIIERDPDQVRRNASLDRVGNEVEWVRQGRLTLASNGGLGNSITQLEPAKKSLAPHTEKTAGRDASPFSNTEFGIGHTIIQHILNGELECSAFKEVEPERTLIPTAALIDYKVQVERGEIVFAPTRTRGRTRQFIKWHSPVFSAHQILSLYPQKLSQKKTQENEALSWFVDLIRRHPDAKQSKLTKDAMWELFRKRFPASQYTHLSKRTFIKLRAAAIEKLGADSYSKPGP